MRVYAQKQPQPQQQASSDITRLGAKPRAANDAALQTPYSQPTLGKQVVPSQGCLKTEGLEVGSDRPATTRFAHDFSRVPLHSPAPIKLQSKLAVNTPGDVYEHEADRISEQVLSMSEPRQRHDCACGGCPKCQSERVAHEHVQTKRIQANDVAEVEAPAVVHEVLRSSGQPLDAATREFFERHLGHDFSRVRVHTDTKAADSARAVNAMAYTVGQNVVFGAGQYAPSTMAGKKLLAHELVHTGQQSNDTRGRVQRQPTPTESKSTSKIGGAEKDYKPAASFTELIELIKVAEQKLKAAGQDVNTRIKTLRGVYYGTTWSLDFVKAEGSAMRNLGFTYFLYGASAMSTANNAFQQLLGSQEKVEPAAAYVPMNPQAILGPKLFEALRNSYEVTNANGRKVDVGHLIIGLEARLSKSNSQERRQVVDPRDLTSIFSTPKQMGGTGLELTTWVGDLGGGAALLAQTRVNAPNASAKIAFQDLHSYGAEVNLEGDIAAFLVGLPDQSATPYGLTLNETTGIAGAMEAYLSPSAAGQKWNTRAKRFLSLYGGTFDENNNLTNKSSVLTIFADKLSKFAYFYKETRLKDEANKKQATNKLTKEQQAKVDEQMKAITEKIPGAANDVANLFIEALTKTVKEPSKGIAP